MQLFYCTSKLSLYVFIIIHNFSVYCLDYMFSIFNRQLYDNSSFIFMSKIAGCTYHQNHSEPSDIFCFVFVLMYIIFWVILVLKGCLLCWFCQYVNEKVQSKHCSLSLSLAQSLAHSLFLFLSHIRLHRYNSTDWAESVGISVFASKIGLYPLDIGCMINPFLQWLDITFL